MFTQAARTSWGTAFTYFFIIKQNKKKKWRRPAETLQPIQLRVGAALQEVVNVHLRRDDPSKSGEVQHGRTAALKVSGKTGLIPPR